MVMLDVRNRLQARAILRSWWANPMAVGFQEEMRSGSIQGVVALKEWGMSMEVGASVLG